MSMKIMFGICTYNRMEIVKLSAESLSRVKNIESVNVCVFDDHSIEYSLPQLKTFYPFAKYVTRADTNGGADVNSLRMLQFFNESSSDWLFIADSDLVYSECLLTKLEKCIEIIGTSSHIGVISVFNTDTHPTTLTIDDFLCEKEEVGAAGVLMNKDISKLVIENKNEAQHYDVCFSKVLREKGYKILCTNKSYVQHIGIEGYNSLFYAFDWANDFVLDSYENATAIINIISLLFSKINESNKKSVESRIEEDVIKERVGIKVLVRMLVKSGKLKLNRLIDLNH